ncbi:MAG: hypothetical protein WC522_04165 [Candidatus Omnitrophota bacterium]
MKKITMLLVAGLIVSVSLLSGEAYAAIKNMPFNDDHLSFVTKRKITFPDSAPISVTKYANGSIREKVFYYGSIISLPNSYQKTITYIFAPGKRDRQGQVMTVVIQGLTDWSKYNISYTVKKVKAVTMTDSCGKSKIYEYNTNGTLNSIITRMEYNGIENILEETISYSYIYYAANRVKTATKTVVTYYTDPDDPTTFGETMNTEILTENYDRRGNLII